MNKNIYKTASFLVALILAICVYIPGQAESSMALMPSRTVNIAHFYKPPEGMDATTAVNSFGPIVLTNGDQTYLQKLKDSGFAFSVPEYFRFDAIQDPGGCAATPSNNQVAYEVGDFCSIGENHPDWFLLDTNGNRIPVTSGGEYYRMDPDNAGWRDFFLSRVVASQEQHGWTALFLDNVEGGLGSFQAARPAKYADDAAYQAVVAGFLHYLDLNYSQKYGRPIMANLVASANDSVWFTYLPYLEGAMKERFAVAWDETSYLSESKWLRDLEQVERALAEGKYLILVSPGNQSDSDRQNFAFASYLLINNGNAAFRYSTDDAYREVWLYNNYQVNLGTAVGPRYWDGSIWRRDFQYGYVMVDPVNHTARIEVTSTDTSTSTPSDAELTLSAPTELIPTLPAETPTLVPTSTIYNDNDPAFVYSGSWEDKANNRSVEGSFKLTKEVDSSATLPFEGATFTVIYKSGPLFGNIDVYVDGQLIGTIDQRTNKQQFQNEWHFDGTLAEGSHELTLIFAGPADARASLDAVIVP
jgi:hypothetical protein